MIVFRILHIAAGFFLYWKDWHDYAGLGDFVSSRYGFALTLGAAAAIGAFLIGLFGTRPNVARLLALAARAATSGGGPPPGAAQEIPEGQARLKMLARTALALIFVAVLLMATARYW